MTQEESKANTMLEKLNSVVEFIEEQVKETKINEFLDEDEVERKLMLFDTIEDESKVKTQLETIEGKMNELQIKVDERSTLYKR